MDRDSAVKILVISHEYPPIGGGGGRVIQDLCEGLASSDYCFTILTAHHGGLPEMEIKEFLCVERLRTGRDETFRASLKTMFFFVWKSFWRALRIIRLWKPDLIHAHFAVPAGASASLAAWLTRTPYILTIHGGDVPGGAPGKTDRWFRLIKPFSGYIWKRAKRIIAVSDYSRQLALSHYPVTIKVIPNGVDRKSFGQSTSAAHTPPKIMFVGRFSPEKNAIAVPEILAQIADLAWTCTMVGDGPQIEEVKEQIAQHRLGGRIQTAGWLSQDAVNRALVDNDILLMPSLRESMPMAGLQALAAGNALILSDVGACTEMVEKGKNGYLLDPADHSGFANALRELLQCPQKLDDFKQASKSKSAQFDIEIVLDQYRQVYRETTGY